MTNMLPAKYGWNPQKFTKFNTTNWKKTDALNRTLLVQSVVLNFVNFCGFHPNFAESEFSLKTSFPMQKMFSWIKFPMDFGAQKEKM